MGRGTTKINLCEASLVFQCWTSELPILDEEGYEFGGWYYDEEFTLPANSGDKLTSNTKLYAKWTLITYSITYITNGHGDDVIVDGLLSIPDKLLKLKDENYVFEGWYLDEELTVKAETGIVMTENVTYYAKWLEASTDFSKQKESVVYNLSSGGYLDGKVEEQWLCATPASIKFEDTGIGNLPSGIKVLF